MPSKKAAKKKTPPAKPAVPARSPLDQAIDSAVESQVNDLTAPATDRALRISAVLQSLKNLKPSFPVAPGDPATTVLDRIIVAVTGIATDHNLAEFGAVLSDLKLLAALPLVTADGAISRVVASVNVQINALLTYRPDVEAVASDLEALKHLKGGPADATAFHDFHVLQMAFKNVWKHAFDQNVQALVEQVYLEHMKLYDEAGLALPPFGAISDINDLYDFLEVTPANISPPDNLMQANPDYDPSKYPMQSDPIAQIIGLSFGKVNSVPALIPTIDLATVMNTFSAGWIWGKLSAEQQYLIWEQAAIVNNPKSTPEERAQANKFAHAILNNPAGPAGRIATLIYKLGLALAEPYAFDVFAPNTYNFGLMLTYRQKWEPGEYQAGDLVATIPLAPGETRKYSKRQTVKQSRATKEVEKALSNSSYQSSETSRAEAAIMQKTVTASNFKMTSSGSFNIGIGSINASSEFGGNQSAESVSNKQQFHEATIKAAQEYRLERNLEVDVASSVEGEQTSSGEISNPNNEITVTYLFYELQRRYQVSEILYRVRPVIMVALEVPSPEDIDEAWLIQYQWIIARVLLDDSFREALGYLTSGLAGDEVSASVLKESWQRQRGLVDAQDKIVTDLIAKRDWLRDAVVNTQYLEDKTKSLEVNAFVNVLSFGMANKPAEMAADQLEAANTAYKSRLDYLDQVLGDAQAKLKQITESYQQAVKDYTAALKLQFSRRVAIDQLRVHVKQNILYYMQAIWSHRVADQTFFELYKLPIDCPDPSSASLVPAQTRMVTSMNSNGALLNIFGSLPTPSSNWNQHELVELADLDNPLGFKGNFIILPLKEHCYITWFMLQEYIDAFTGGLRDPDDVANFLETFDAHWLEAVATGQTIVNNQTYTPATLKTKLAEYLSLERRSTDEIIVPSGQLFIEALPGSHPLLEDFKLLHRVEDVRKVQAEVRHAELENLRLAARLAAGELQDPDVEKKIVVEGGTGSVLVGTG